LESPIPLSRPWFSEEEKRRVERNMLEISFTYANFWDVHDMNRTFDAVGAIRWNSMNLSGGNGPARLTVASTTVGFFRALGVRPMAGRCWPGCRARA